MHDLSDYQGACETGLTAIGAMAKTMQRMGKPFVHVSGTTLCLKGVLATENMVPEIIPPLTDRARNDQ